MTRCANAYQFQLSSNIQTLMNNNYRVRIDIFKSFQYHAENYSLCSAQSNFVLALCCQISFGTRRNVLKSQNFLNASRKRPIELAECIDGIKNRRTWSYENKTVTALSTDGLIRPLDLIDDYRHAGHFDDAEEHYCHELSDLRNTFDTTHPIITVLQGHSCHLSGPIKTLTSETSP